MPVGWVPRLIARWAESGKERPPAGGSTRSCEADSGNEGTIRSTIPIPDRSQYEPTPCNTRRYQAAHTVRPSQNPRR